MIVSCEHAIYPRQMLGPQLHFARIGFSYYRASNPSWPFFFESLSRRVNAQDVTRLRVLHHAVDRVAGFRAANHSVDFRDWGVSTVDPLTAADLAAMRRATVSTNANGVETTYEGVWISDVLKKAGLNLGPAQRGAVLASYVVAPASRSDGRSVPFWPAKQMERRLLAKVEPSVSSFPKTNAAYGGSACL
jgi:hypothetical protein